MNTDMSETAEMLEAVLEVERYVLSTGNFGTLTEIIAEKSRLIDMLDAEDAGSLARLQESARQNQALLDAALKGMRAAQQRITAIRQAGHTLNSYDDQGRAKQIIGDHRSVERRA